MRFFPNAASAAKNATPIFLSSGAEDYFLSASYFDEGEFLSPNAGLTYKNGGAVGAFKMHDLRDQVRWAVGGGRTVFYCGGVFE